MQTHLMFYTSSPSAGIHFRFANMDSRTTEIKKHFPGSRQISKPRTSSIDLPVGNNATIDDQVHFWL